MEIPIRFSASFFLFFLCVHSCWLELYFYLMLMLTGCLAPLAPMGNPAASTPTLLLIISLDFVSFYKQEWMIDNTIHLHFGKQLWMRHITSCRYIISIEHTASAVLLSLASFIERGQFYMVYNIHEKNSRFWLTESSAVQNFNTSANYTSKFWIKIRWKTIGNILSQ